MGLLDGAIKSMMKDMGLDETKLENFQKKAKVTWVCGNCGTIICGKDVCKVCGSPKPTRKSDEKEEDKQDVKGKDKGKNSKADSGNDSDEPDSSFFFFDLFR